MERLPVAPIISGSRRLARGHRGARSGREVRGLTRLSRVNQSIQDQPGSEPSGGQIGIGVPHRPCVLGRVGENEVLELIWGSIAISAPTGFPHRGIYHYCYNRWTVRQVAAARWRLAFPNGRFSASPRRAGIPPTSCTATRTFAQERRLGIPSIPPFGWRARRRHACGPGPCAHGASEAAGAD